MSGETVLVTQPTVLTIGHSTRALEPFIEMLRAHGVKHLADIRAFDSHRFKVASFDSGGGTFGTIRKGTAVRSAVSISRGSSNTR
jgi:hypothetical protein